MRQIPALNDQQQRTLESVTAQRAERGPEGQPHSDHDGREALTTIYGDNRKEPDE